jgi:hypothetical protein
MGWAAAIGFVTCIVRADLKLQRLCVDLLGMLSVRFAHFGIVVLVAACIGAATAQSAAAAPSLPEVRSTFSLVQELLTDGAELPSGEAMPVDGFASNVVASADGSGYYAVSVTGEPLRDEDGVLLDQLPQLVKFETFSGRVLVPTGVAGVSQYGVTAVPAPAGDSADALLGEDLFSAVGIGLVGRAAVDGSVFEGGAYYPDVLPGVSQLFVVGPGEVKEMALLENASAAHMLRYDLDLPLHASARETTVDGEPTIEVVDGDGHVMLEVVAPLAVDAAGRTYSLDIDLDADGAAFTVSFDHPTDSVAYPLLLDPTYTLRNYYESGSNGIDSGDPHLGEGKYMVDFCGSIGDEVDDQEDGTDNADSFGPCATGNNTSDLLFLGQPFPSSKFTAVIDDTAGVALAVPNNTTVSKDDAAAIGVQAPEGVGIMSSHVRGHVGDPAGHYTCAFQYGMTRGQNDGHLFQYPAATMGYDPTHRDSRLWGSAPQGTGSSAWATWPLDHVAIDFHDGPTRSHMVAMFDMEGYLPWDDPSLPHWGGLSGGLQFQPDRISMTMKAEQGFTGSGNDNCKIDGHWTVMFWDPEAPTAGAARFDSTRWYSNDEIATINGTLTRPERAVDLSDAGSGVRSAEAFIDGDSQGSRPVCPAPSIQQNVDATEAKTTLSRPCPISATASLSRSTPPADLNIFPSASGRHIVRWLARDFVNRADLGPLVPAIAQATQPTAGDVGYYWVDANPPSCEVLGINPAAGQATVRWSDLGASLAVKKGSGVRRVEVWLDRDWSQSEASIVSRAPDAVLSGLSGADEVARVIGGLSILADPTLSDTPRVFVRVTDAVDKKGMCYSADTKKPDDLDVRVHRGAAGVVATWARPTDPSGNSLPGSGTRRYEWEAYLSALPPAPSTLPYASGTVTSLHSDLVRGAPGTKIWIRVRAEDWAGNKTLWTTSCLASEPSGRTDCSEDVDRRPVVTTPDSLSTNPVATSRHFSHPVESKFVADAANNSGAATPLLNVQVRDPDGNLDARYTPITADLADGDERDRTLDDDGTRVVVAVEPAVALRAGVPNAQARIIWDVQAGEDIFWMDDTGAMDTDEALATRDLGTSADTCTRGAGQITGTFWVLDCAATTVAGIGTGFDLALALRPRGDNTGAFPTPDLRYALSGWARDQSQPADNRYLYDRSGIGVDDSADTTDPIDESAFSLQDEQHQTPSVDLGPLVLDRVVPTASVTMPTTFPGDVIGFATNNPVVPLTADANDIEPNAGTTPLWQDESGMGDMRFRVVDRTPGTGADAPGPVIRLSETNGTPDAMPCPLFTVAPAQATDGWQCTRTWNSGVPIGGIAHYNVRATAVDVARNVFRSPTHRLTVDREPPVWLTRAPIAVRGATGIVAAWGDANDQTGVGIWTDAQVAQNATRRNYEWRAEVQDGAGNWSWHACSAGGVWQRPIANRSEANWMNTTLCTGAPGTAIRFEVRVLDRLGNVGPTVVVSETVDQRPTIAVGQQPEGVHRTGHVPGGTDWHGTLDDRPWFDDSVSGSGYDVPRNDLLVIDLADPDVADASFNASFNHRAVWDGHSPAGRPIAGDRMRSVLHITDQNAPANGPRHDVFVVTQYGASAAQTRTAITTSEAKATAWSEPGASIPIASNCAPQAATLLIAGSWEFDCTEYVVAAGRLTLPLRALGNSQNAGFVTPDDVYRVDGWVRDRLQDADSQYLTSQRVGAAFVPADAPYAWQSAANTWPNAEVLLGTIRLDRIRPLAWLVQHGTSTLVSPVAGATPVAPVGSVQGSLVNGVLQAEVDVLGQDIAPTPANQPDPIPGPTDPTSRTASGLHVINVGAPVVVSGGTLSTQTVGACAPPAPLPSTSQTRCAILLGVANVSGTVLAQVTVTVVDHVGNYQVLTLPFRILLPPPPPCGDRDSDFGTIDLSLDANPNGDNGDPSFKPRDTFSASRLVGLNTANGTEFDYSIDPQPSRLAGRVACAGKKLQWQGNANIDGDATATGPKQPFTIISERLINGAWTPLHSSALLPGETQSTWRSNINLDGTPNPAGPLVASTSRLFRARITHAGTQYYAWVETVARMAPNNDAKGYPAYVEFRVWRGAPITTPLNDAAWDLILVDRSPDYEVHTTGLLGQCKWGCENSPIFN